MTPSPASIPLDSATLSTMLRSTFEALTIGPNASPEDIAALRQAALIALIALRPRDPVEAMLAARIVCAQNASMECFRRAGQPDIGDTVLHRLTAKAIALASFASRTQRELRQLQAAPPAYALPEQDEPTAAPRQAEPTVTAPPSPAAAHDPREPRPLPASGPSPTAKVPSPHPAVIVPATPAEAMRARVADDVVANARPPATEPAAETTALAA